MNAKDLMLGDWIRTVAGIIQVSLIAEKMVYCSVPTGHKSWEITMIEPIPLTAEILEKNGFEYEENVGYVYDDQMGVMVAYSTFIRRLRIIKDLNILYDSQDFADIYVHTLQHALRLCGIDKEIVLP